MFLLRARHDAAGMLSRAGEGIPVVGRGGSRARRSVAALSGGRGSAGRAPAGEVPAGVRGLAEERLWIIWSAQQLDRAEVLGGIVNEQPILVSGLLVELVNPVCLA